jgi:glycosyltransferase involved in cell wall biosynthesis
MMTTSPTPPHRIAYILKMFPRFSETFILSEILELERSGLDVRIFSLKVPNDPLRHADVDRVQGDVTYVPDQDWRAAGRYAWRHLQVAAWSPGRYLNTAFRTMRRRRWGAVKRFLQAGYIAPELKREGITHVHAHFASSATSVSWYLNQLIGIEYSFTAHAKDIYIDSVAEDVLVRKLSNARFAVTVSDYNREYLSSLAPGVPLARVYNGLDLSRFAPLSTSPSSDEPLILAVGRLVEKKGFADLITACGVLRDDGVRFRCLIVGTGDQESKLRAQIQRLGLEEFVQLPGPMPREDLIDLYPQASVVIAPCVVGADGNRDGLPTVLIEAMALGVPVISTPVTGIPELVRHEETGLLIAEHAPHELASAVRRVLGQPEWARDLASAGRKLVEERFDLTRNVATLRALLEARS